MKLTTHCRLQGIVDLTGGSMKNVFKVLMILTVSGSAFADQVPTAVQKAHEAYTRGDGNAVVAEVKSALEQSNGQSAIKKNMLGLYAAAARNGLLKNVEPNWHLPKELTYAGFESQRRYKVENGKVVYFLAVSLGVQNGASLEQLQVIRYPDQVVFDKAANIGNWNITPGTVETDIWAGSSQTMTPNEEGLYLLNVQVKGQPMVQAWFILTDKNSSASPVVNSPKSGQALSDDRPLFKWNAFRSPEFKQGEKTRIDVKFNIARGDEPEVSQVRMIDSNATSYRFGDKTGVKEFNGPEKLAQGDYMLSIVYREVEDFGGLQLKRTSSTKVPFTIKP